MHIGSIHITVPPGSDPKAYGDAVTEALAKARQQRNIAAVPQWAAGGGG